MSKKIMCRQLLVLAVLLMGTGGVASGCAKPSPEAKIPLTLTPTATATHMPTPFPTPEPTATPTLTPRPTATSTPKPTPTATRKPTATPTPTPTPYQREFENIAGKDNILIGAFYYPWYNRNDPYFSHWFNRDVWKRRGFKGEPLLGGYDSRDPDVIRKHIDWATGHGIDFFLVSWGFHGPGTFTDIVLKDHFLRSELVCDIKFAILYETNGRLKSARDELLGYDIVNLDDSRNQEILFADFDYFERVYFNHPQYLRIHDAPVVFFDILRLFGGDVVGVFDKLRDRMKLHYGHDLFIISDQATSMSPDDPLQREIAEAVDAIGTYQAFQWAPHFFDPSAAVWTDFESYVPGVFGPWKSLSQSLGKYFAPGVVPGWDKRGVDPDLPVLPKSPERFKKQIEIAKDFIDPELPMVLITSWNEWFEYTAVEPSEEHGFRYLEIIKESLAGY